MLPGEEFAFERYYRGLKAYGRRCFEWLIPPSTESWWIDPNAITAILLSIIALLLTIHHLTTARGSDLPRRAIRGLKRMPRRLRRATEIAAARMRTQRRPAPRGQPRFRFRRPPIADYAHARGVLEGRLAAMVGLATIKEHLLTLLDTLEMDQRRCASMPGFVSQRGCMHMVFLGNPGTGKTAVAQLVSCVLKEMGVLRRGHLVVARKDDLLGRYSNHVARNTRAIVESAVGGVLLIDEAYALLQGEVELGREVLNVLVELCYAYKDELVVVLAGYTRAMAALFDANAGLASRFPHKFAFADYAVDELAQIAGRMLEGASFALADAAAEEALRRLVAPIVREAPCGNARSVENRYVTWEGANPLSACLP